MITVLLALDDAERRGFYVANLQTAGFRVVATRTALAVRTAHRIGPQAIVVDASRAGEETRCAALKDQPDLPGVPVIALAGTDVAPAVERTCDLVLPVECLPDVLVDAIDRLVLRTRN
jgi:DNA-binding response OmpR family regulator